MPEVEHTTVVAASLPEIWAFVEDMDNWAPFLTGYQRHEKIDRDQSIWVVKGELGGLTRAAEFRVNVTEWDEPSRVTFTMQGVQEPVTGSGEFLAVALGDGAPGGAPGGGMGGAAPAVPPPAAGGWFARLRDRLSRWLLRRATNSVDVRPVAATPVAGAGNTQITFRLNVQAGGATGPVLNLLLGPMLKPVAEDLAMKIARAVDQPG